MRRSVVVLLAGVAAAVFAVVGMAGAARAGDNEVLSSAIRIDRAEGTVTLPLFKGTHEGETVWYVVTESSSEDDAERRGVNHAEKLENALGTRAVQKVRMVNGAVRFDGTVNFAPTAGCGDVDPHNIPCMYERSSKTSDEMVFTHHACGSIALKTAAGGSSCPDLTASPRSGSSPARSATPSTARSSPRMVARY